MNKTFVSFWIPNWLSYWPFLAIDDLLSIYIWWLKLLTIKIGRCPVLFDLMLFYISYVTSKGISHKGFSRFKRTVKYLEKTFLNVWTRLEINENKKESKSLPFSPSDITSAMCRTEMNTKSDNWFFLYISCILMHKHIYIYISLNLWES